MVSMLEPSFKFLCKDNLLINACQAKNYCYVAYLHFKRIFMKELPDNRVVLQDRLLEYTTATLSPQHPDPLSSLRVHSVRYCG